MSAHNGWITGMDLASQSGLLLTCAEDGYVRSAWQGVPLHLFLNLHLNQQNPNNHTIPPRVWQLATRGPLIEHWFSKPVS